MTERTATRLLMMTAAWCMSAGMALAQIQPPYVSDSDALLTAIAQAVRLR